MQSTGETRAVDLWEKLEEHSKDVLIPTISKSLWERLFVSHEKEIRYGGEHAF